MMVNGPRILLRPVQPCLYNLEHKDGVGVDESGVDDPAFEVGEALRNERRGNARGRNRRQAEGLELVDPIAVTVADSDDLLRKLNGGDCDDALLRRPQRLETEVSVAYDTRYPRWLELDTHVPGHGHHIGAALVRGREHHDGPGLEQLVNF